MGSNDGCYSLTVWGPAAQYQGVGRVGRQSSQGQCPGFWMVVTAVTSLGVLWLWLITRLCVHVLMAVSL